jgi:hypothetical protein
MRRDYCRNAAENPQKTFVRQMWPFYATETPR